MARSSLVLFVDLVHSKAFVDVSNFLNFGNLACVGVIFENFSLFDNR